LDLADAVFPGEQAAGRVGDPEFAAERVYLQGNVLALRQGSGQGPDLAVNVYLPVREEYELAGRYFNIRTNDAGLLPRIVLRWKEENRWVGQTITNGYAMRLEFGTMSREKSMGQIYLCLPDTHKSFVAGTFNAEIRKLAAPKE
jgi:hypothetical protein